MADLLEYILEALPLLALELGKVAVVAGDLTCLIRTWLETVGKEDGLVVVEEAGHRRIGKVDLVVLAEAAMQSSKYIFECPGGRGVKPLRRRRSHR